MKFVRFRSGLSENFLNTVKLFRWSVPPFLRFLKSVSFPDFLSGVFCSFLFLFLCCLYNSRLFPICQHVFVIIFYFSFLILIILCNISKLFDYLKLFCLSEKCRRFFHLPSNTLQAPAPAVSDNRRSAVFFPSRPHCPDLSKRPPAPCTGHSDI